MYNTDRQSVGHVKREFLQHLATVFLPCVPDSSEFNRLGRKQFSAYHGGKCARDDLNDRA